MCAEGKPALPAFFDQVMAAISADPTAKVVIDLRHNPGGNSALLEPLIARLSGLRGRLYTVIGRKTFSSAILNALSLARIGATLIGEPAAGKPSHHGEVKTFPLPRSGLIVMYSTKYFRNPDHETDSLLPEIPVELSYADWAAGRDPVLGAILKR
jgi:C-terminal processing protease CtpA/Prc